MEEKFLVLEKAKKEQQSGNYQKSFDLLERIFDINDYFITFEYAKTLYFLKKYEEAVNIFLILNKKK